MHPRAGQLLVEVKRVLTTKAKHDPTGYHKANTRPNWVSQGYTQERDNSSLRLSVCNRTVTGGPQVLPVEAVGLRAPACARAWHRVASVAGYSKTLSSQQQLYNDFVMPRSLCCFCSNRHAPRSTHVIMRRLCKSGYPPGILGLNSSSTGTFK